MPDYRLEHLCSCDRMRADEIPARRMVMSTHVFVDETKGRSYVVVAVLLPADSLSTARKQLRALCKSGQRRIHFTNEGDRRRRELLAAMCALDLRAVIYDGARHGKDHRAARRACLDAVVSDLAVLDAQMLVVELDESVVANDRRWLYAQVRATGCERRLRYVHKRAHEEELPAIPDGIARAWTHGREWRRRIDGIVAEVRAV